MPRTVVHRLTPALRVAREPSGGWSLHDARGLICETHDVTLVLRAIDAESKGTSHYQGKALLYYWAGARELIFPGSALAYVESMSRSVTVPPPPDPRSGAEILADLGLL